MHRKARCFQRRIPADGLFTAVFDLRAQITDGDEAAIAQRHIFELQRSG